MGFGLGVEGFGLYELPQLEHGIAIRFAQKYAFLIITKPPLNNGGGFFVFKGCFRVQVVVARAGLEPATFGL